MNRKRVSASFGIASAAIGLAASMMLPVASAGPVGNGLTVDCTQDSDIHATCIIGGCPRVNGDYVVDAVHAIVHGQITSNETQHEYDFKCINGQTARQGVDTAPGGTYTISVQGCRKKDLEGDWCGPWGDYVYKSPAKPAAPAPAPAPEQQPVICPPNSQQASVPAGQQCTPKPPVKCGPDSPVPEVPAGDTCPVTPPPTDAVALNFARSGFQLNATFKNSSKVAAQCHYDAQAAGGTAVGGKTDDFALGANATVTRTYTGPPIGSTYHVVVSCNGKFNGQNVEIGHIDQNFDF